MMIAAFAFGIHTFPPASIQAKELFSMIKFKCLACG
jgi:hypothetical protein